MLTSINKKFDRRKFNIPPINPNTVKKFTKTVSSRVEEHLIDRLIYLLNRRYNNKKVPMNSISFVIRRAIIMKIRELEYHTKK
jgi:hypothetical protein